MATITRVGTPTSDVRHGITSFFARMWALVWGAPHPVATETEMATPTSDVEESLTVWLFSRIRTFLWVSSGLFSAACLAIPAIGALAYGTFDGLETSFLAAILSACFFGLGSVLHFGPDII